ncbi:MAG: YggS family pyridoxal phosphate-dependent enzyme [Saprospiraceae bacterium]|nr:MAG: YggS family pyridoxal phosphate-dependent enzyme [Saprospiraceae bacterium]
MLSTILSELKPSGTRLVAVSKTKPTESIMALYEEGQRIFGENRVQEIVPKHDTLPKDIEWHFIGRLQINKVKYIAPFIRCIHSVESLRLLEEIEKQAGKNDRVIDCLLQFHICDEATKIGMTIEEADLLLQSAALQAMGHVRIAGIMGMATFTDDVVQIRQEFKNLKGIFERLKNRYFQDSSTFREISMGMSGDYQIAIEEGSTLVRIGTLLFGKR